MFIVIDCEFNRANYKDMIGKIFKNPPGYASVIELKSKKSELDYNECLTKFTTFLSSYLNDTELKYNQSEKIGDIQNRKFYLGKITAISTIIDNLKQIFKM